MKHARQSILDYVEGSLTEGDADKVRQHLSACPDCRRHESDIRSALRALRSAHPSSPLAPQSSILPRVRRSIDAKLLHVHREPWFAPIVRLAAPVLAAVVVVFILVTMSTGPAEERFADDVFIDDPASFVMTDLAGQTYDLILADSMFIDASMAVSDIPSVLAHIMPYDISGAVDDLTDDELNALAIALDERSSL